MGKARRFRRGIYLLPTIFTIGNIFCGVYALVLAFRGEFERSAMMIIVAGILDGLDGRIARMTGTTSDFGNEFDSLADVISFGVAPAMLAYNWALLPLARVGWLVAFLYVVCAATRLARFNIRATVGDKRFFAGLPSPAAAGALATAAFAFPGGPRADWLVVCVALFVASLGLLMVSRVRYRSFKELQLGSRRSYLFVVPLAVVLVAVAIQPKGALLLISSLYLLSAPFGQLWSVLRRTRSRQPHEVLEANEKVADEPALR